jgi:hypothetical protein
MQQPDCMQGALTCIPPCLHDEGAAAAVTLIIADAEAHALAEPLSPSLESTRAKLEPVPIIADRIAARKEAAAMVLAQDEISKQCTL